MPKSKTSQKTQTTSKRRGQLRADEIPTAFTVARNASDKLAAKFLVVNASDEVFEEVHSAFLMLFSAIGCRQRLTGGR
jgi:hypothetical protein